MLWSKRVCSRSRTISTAVGFGIGWHWIGSSRMAERTHGIRLKHLRREKDGRLYLRRNGRSIRLIHPVGTPEFHAEYARALATGPGLKTSPPADAPGSFTRLVQAYMASPEFGQLAANTRTQRRSILERLAKAHGAKPFAQLQQRHVRAMRDERAAVPNAANALLKALRALFKWAVAAGHAHDNPAVGVPKLRHSTAGHHTWTPEEVRRFLDYWGPGTKARLALTLLLYTGARISDVVRFGPQMVQDGFLSYKSVKTGTDVILPILPILQAELSAHPTIAGTWLRDGKGRPYKAGTFGQAFARWSNAAGVNGSAHGLRKAAATLAAENGATEAQLNAIFGWGDGSPEARRYTRAANRKRLAADGARLISVPPKGAGTKDSEKAS